MNGGNTWREFTQQNVAHSGESFYVLLVDNTNGHNDQLFSPTFSATAGAEFILEYAYRMYSDGLAAEMRVVLADAEAFTIVKTLSTGTNDSNIYREINLHFDVPRTGTYFIAFLVTTPAGGRGVLLDDVAIKPHAGPLGGAASLVGDADDACTTLDAYGLNGAAYTCFVDANGRLAVEIDLNGNDLGDVIVEMRDYAAPPLSPAINTRFLSRHFNITPTNGGGSYTTNGGVRVRLYYTAAELVQLSNVANEDLIWEDITIFHCSDINQDCDIGNSSGFDVQFEEVTSVLPFADGVFALEFTTTGFSEFGGTSTAASAGFPVVLRSFGATEWGSGNRLDWVVDSEIDFSHYTVQRSDDGLTFTDLARVEGAGSARYPTTDAAPAALQYYRLSMVDHDGSFAYSRIVSVERDYRQQHLSAYPVPTTGEVTVRFTETEAGRVCLRLVDGLGRTVLRDRYRAAAGTNERMIDLSGLPAGYYTLLLSGAGKTRSFGLYRK